MQKCAEFTAGAIQKDFLLHFIADNLSGDKLTCKRV